jgi:hypothetical protein
VFCCDEGLGVFEGVLLDEAIGVDPKNENDIDERCKIRSETRRE